MTNISKEKLQNFVLNFEDNVVSRLKDAGFERNRYNVFDILNINRQELRHSDFLAFLLNPCRSGEVGRQFLHNFLSLLSKDNPELKLDFFKMFYCEFEKVTVKREYKQIDILLDIKLSDSDNEYIFVIENKVDSGEQVYENKDEKGQLEKYKKIVETEYKNHIPIYLFLSPDKRLPSENAWCAIDYSLIYSALCMLKIDSADSTIKTLIQDYKKMLRGQFDMENDEELRKIALNIYKSDKDIFDFIFENRPNRINTSAEIIRKYLKNVGFVHFDIDKSKRQNANIVFTTHEIFNLCNHIYFQINVNDMVVWAYIEEATESERVRLGIKDCAKIKSLTKSIYLFGDKGKTSEGIEMHNNLLLNNNQEELEADLKRLLETTFAQNGIIALQSIKICNQLKNNEIKQQ